MKKNCYLAELNKIYFFIDLNNKKIKNNSRITLLHVSNWHKVFLKYLTEKINIFN